MNRSIKQILRGIWPTPAKLTKPQKLRCVGGPLDGETLALRTGGTMTFTLGGRTGAYLPSEKNPKTIIWEERKEICHE